MQKEREKESVEKEPGLQHEKKAKKAGGNQSTARRPKLTTKDAKDKMTQFLLCRPPVYRILIYRNLDFKFFWRPVRAIERQKSTEEEED